MRNRVLFASSTLSFLPFPPIHNLSLSITFVSLCFLPCSSIQCKYGSLKDVGLRGFRKECQLFFFFLNDHFEIKNWADCKMCQRTILWFFTLHKKDEGRDVYKETEANNNVSTTVYCLINATSSKCSTLIKMQNYENSTIYLPIWVHIFFRKYLKNINYYSIDFILHLVNRHVSL